MRTRLQNILRGILAGILLTLFFSFSAFADEVPAEYREYWDAINNEAKELGAEGMVYDSSLADVWNEYMENMRALWAPYPDQYSLPGDGSLAKQEFEYLAPLYSREMVLLAYPYSGDQYDFSMASDFFRCGFHNYEPYYLKRAAIVKWSNGQDGFPFQGEGLLLIGSLQGDDPENGWHYDADKCYRDCQPKAGQTFINLKGSYAIPGSLPDLGSLLQYKENGTPVQNGWRQIRGEWFYFKDGLKMTGRAEIDGNIYLLTEVGRFDDGWIIPVASETYAGPNNQYYTPDGIMLKNAYTPDGFWVDENGSSQRVVPDTQGAISANQNVKGEEATYLFQTINEIRVQNGKQPLQWSPERAAYLDAQCIQGNTSNIAEDYGIPGNSVGVLYVLPKYENYEELKTRDYLDYRDLGNGYLMQGMDYDKYILGDYQKMAVIENTSGLSVGNGCIANGCILNFGK